MRQSERRVVACSKCLSENLIGCGEWASRTAETWQASTLDWQDAHDLKNQGQTITSGIGSAQTAEQVDYERNEWQTEITKRSGSS